ncbi:MAG: hypothetical protein GY928_26025, partial [Colwellia sp.]|nr:hypothetical protein [Colwellia sp.]
PVPDSTVSGTADADSDVHVGVHDTDGVWRHEIATGGAWTADFSVPGDEEGEDPFDLWPGTAGSASQCDDDGDCTQVNWYLANTGFSVNPFDGGVWGQDWAPDHAVDIFINDPTMTGSPAQVVPTDPEGSFGTGFDPAEFGAGDTITVTDDTTTKHHDITPLVVTAVLPVPDSTVSGTADADSDVHVGVHDTDGVWRHEIATGGAWTADFSVPG